MNSGRIAENQALEFLQQQGLTLVDRNYRCRRGEIDLIMQHSGTLVFVEVRFRKTSRYGSALESVDPRKQARIIHCATQYLASHRASVAARFDVVAISPNKGNLNIDWIPDAFQT